MQFKYELHTHTAEVSKCSNITGAELVRFYKECGYTGICITDHFFNGNIINMSEDLSWPEQVELFCKGYENAYQEGKKIGLDVFFGWEFALKGHFLTFGLGREWLLDHPEILDINIIEYFDLIHKDGGYIIHAHPFRESDIIRLMPDKVDAIEVLNASRTDFANKMADIYADNYNISKVGGSDNHAGQQQRLCGINSSVKFENINEMIKNINENKIDLYTNYL